MTLYLLFERLEPARGQTGITTFDLHRVHEQRFDERHNVVIVGGRAAGGATAMLLTTNGGEMD